jgi:hypothetical protein
VFGALISLEFLVICTALALNAWAPGLLIKVGSSLRSHKEAFQWVSIACVGVLVFSLRWAHEILIPKHEHAAVLADWPDFYMVKNRTLIAVCYVVAGTCAALTMWIFGIDIRESKLSAIYYTAVCIVMTSAFTLWYASIQLGIRLRRIRDKPK